MLDGERLPCVSDLCRFLHREIYRDAPIWQMEAAAERGTAVHQATEYLDKHGTVSVNEEYLPYIQAYAAFRREHDVKWELIEYATYHPTHRYAGTIDRFGTVDGFLTLLDLKTVYTTTVAFGRHAAATTYSIQGISAHALPVRNVVLSGPYLHLTK